MEEHLLPKKKYRERVLKAIKADTSHPYHHGVKMQAHHLVSAKGVQNAGVGKKLEALGYDINDLNNIVLIPSTLQGACHLKTQLHRGDHSFALSDDDNDHPRTYHRAIQKKLTAIERFLDDCGRCNSEAAAAATQRKVQNKVDKISKDVCDLINDFTLPLTRIYGSFEPESKTGCANVDKAGDHKDGNHCDVERNHFQQQANTQKSESITYRPLNNYKIRVGQ